MRGVRWGVLLGLMLVGGVQPSAAQIRLVPQAKLDSVANPPTIQERAMRFDEEELQFGSIDELGGAWQGVFRWTNIAEQPLVITRVVSSCSCLTADFGREPVATGKRAELRVSYHPKGHPGVVRQRLYLYTNHSKERPTAILTVRGVVVRDRELEAHYPHRCGGLLLKSDGVEFERTKEVQRFEIACLNEGDKSIVPQLDTLLTPRGFTLRGVPRELPPQSEGRLLIEYDPSKVQGSVPIRALYLQGNGTPSGRKIALRWKAE